MKLRPLLLAIATAVLVLMPVAGQGKAKGDVYVLGVREGRASVLWKNSATQGLGQALGDDATVGAIFVSGKDVYMAGSRRVGGDEGRDVLTLWKNGKAQQYGELGANGKVNSMFVSGGDVYIAGAEDNKDGNPVATLWKNGKAQRLSDGTDSAWALSVFVAGADVYVAGYGYGKERVDALLWKNGSSRRLDCDDCMGAWAQSVFVSGGDVYVAGRGWNSEDRSAALVWKNGRAQFLTKWDGQHSAESVFVSGGDVYVAGYEDNVEGTSIATLWKNGKALRLSDGSFPAWAQSVFVAGADVYVAWHGYCGYNDEGTVTEVMLWKNGSSQGLNGGEARTARSVLVSGIELGTDTKKADAKPLSDKEWIDMVEQKCNAALAILQKGRDALAALKRANEGNPASAGFANAASMSMANIANGYYESTGMTIASFRAGEKDGVAEKIASYNRNLAATLKQAAAGYRAAQPAMASAGIPESLVDSVVAAFTAAADEMEEVVWPAIAMGPRD